MTFVHCVPRTANMVAYVLAAILALVLGILLLVLWDKYNKNVFVGSGPTILD